MKIVDSKKVWVTGARGFIGRNLTLQLAKSGCEVFGIGHGHWPDVEVVNWGMKGWVNGEIDAVNLSELMTRSGRPETIYHLAGGSSVGVSFQNPLEDFRRTVETTARLLDWIRCNQSSTRLVLVSSAAVYGAGYCEAIEETADIKPYSPYGANKALMEMMCRSYVENFGINSVVVRLFSVYGNGLQKQLLWDLCSKLARDGKATLGGTGAEVRDWIHVSDVAKLLMHVAEHASKDMPIINGGVGVGVKVQDIAQLVVQSWGNGVEVSFTGQSRVGDPANLVADVTRSSSMNYLPSMPLEDGIKKYVSWFKSTNSII